MSKSTDLVSCEPRLPESLSDATCAGGNEACAWHARYHQAFHDAPAPMSISTYADGRFIDVNASFLRMIGFAREELIGRTSHELRFWYDHADRRELLRQLEASDGMLRFEAFPLRTKAGEQVWTDVCAQATEMNGMPCLLIIYNEHRLRRQKQRRGGSGGRRRRIAVRGPGSRRGHRANAPFLQVEGIGRVTAAFAACSEKCSRFERSCRTVS